MINHKYKSKKYQQKYFNLKTKNNMEEAIKEIRENDKITFKFVNIKLSCKEKHALDNCDVPYAKTFDYFGVVNNPKLSIELTKFIHSLDNKSKTKTIANILVHRIVKSYLEALNADSLWLTIRAMPVNPNYDVTRWHLDGKYYNFKEDYQFKLAGVLKGPATLFKEDSDSMRATFIPLFENYVKNYDSENKENDSQKRKEIDDKIKNYPTTQAGENQVAIFTVGNKLKSAIHSEPQIDKPRIFYSIIAGNKNQIKELADRYNTVFIN